jgi:mRNA interferase RelE/StbE
MYQIEYHEKISDDLSRLTSTPKTRIKKAVEEKLTNNPLIFGKPLQNSLKNVRSTRVGDYRIIFMIHGKKVKILAIGHRSIVYNIAKIRALRS